MSTAIKMTTDGEEFFPVEFAVDFFRETSDATASTSIKGGNILLAIDFEEEKDDRTFFASWFQELKEKDVTFDVTEIAPGGKKILSIQLTGALCVGYSLTNAQRGARDNKEQNSLARIILIAPEIVIGQSTLKVGER
jgi:hypothetical protein